MKKNKGACWCVHHRILLEWCHDYRGRAAFIKKNKPKHERSTRLYEMQFAKNLPKEVAEKCEAHGKAKVAEENWLLRLKGWAVYSDNPSQDDNMCLCYEKTGKAEKKAWWVLAKAVKKHKRELETLHKKQIPDTCWNGERLVFEKEQK